MSRSAQSASNRIDRIQNAMALHDVIGHECRGDLKQTILILSAQFFGVHGIGKHDSSLEPRSGRFALERYAPSPQSAQVLP